MLERVARELGRMPEFGTALSSSAEESSNAAAAGSSASSSGEGKHDGEGGEGDLAAKLRDAGLSDDDARGTGARVRVSFFEIHGKKAYDLLRGRSEVHLRSDAEVRNLRIPQVSV